MHLPPHISGNPNCCCFFSRPANSILRQLTEVPQPDQVYFLVSKTLKYTKSQIHKYKNTKIQKYKNTHIQKYKSTKILFTSWRPMLKQHKLILPSEN